MKDGHKNLSLDIRYYLLSTNKRTMPIDMEYPLLT